MTRLSPDLVAKVTGRAAFVTDIALPGMLHAAILRSPWPHARIRRLDASAAEAAPGVVAVLSAADFDGTDTRWGPSVRDRPVIATGRVRHVGEPVAVVAARSAREAEDALDLIDVDYEPLPFVTEADEALAPGAPLIHDEIEPLEDFYFRGRARPVPGTNIFQETTWSHGDVEAALAAAAYVSDEVFTFPGVAHYALEPHCVVAHWTDDGLTLWTCAQSPGAVQKVVARLFGLPMARVRIIAPFVGGGFGGKASVKLDPLAAAIARKVRAPVRLALTLQDSMLTCRRLSASIRLRTGVAADGTILAKAVAVTMNGGAYADTGPAVALKAANRAIGPYRIPALSLEARAVYTNTVPGAAFRSIGGPQAVWACESQMDMIAAAIGLDPGELRRRNLLERGEHVRPDLRPIDVDMGEAIGLARQAMSRLEAAEPGVKLPVGLAVAATDPGIMPVSGVLVRLAVDGSVTVASMSVEIGQGVREVMRVAAAEALDQPIERVVVATPDTALAPFDWGTGASRSSVMMGLAIADAARDILRQLREMAVPLAGDAAGRLVFAPGGLTGGSRTFTFAEILHAAHGIDSGEVAAIGRVTPRSKDGDLARAPLFWETSTGLVAIDLDEETGDIRVRRYVGVADVGKVLVRAAAEGQDEGAAIQGLGHALGEELVYQDGQPVNANPVDYAIPTIEDVPHAFETVLIESGGGPGPGGARGMGEGAILPMAPAIANALAAAWGIRIRDLPLTPERVWRALEAKRSGGEPGS